jgi:hypothetical protein
VGEYISPPGDYQEDYTSGRVDHQLSTNHSIFGRYILTTAGARSRGDSQVWNPVGCPQTVFHLAGSSILTPTLLNSFRFAFNRRYRSMRIWPPSPNWARAVLYSGLTMGRIEIGQRFTRPGDGPLPESEQVIPRPVYGL